MLKIKIFNKMFVINLLTNELFSYIIIIANERFKEVNKHEEIFTGFCIRRDVEWWFYIYDGFCFP